jgi:hypothetical protein
MKTFKVISLILIVGLLVGKPITSASDSDCSPSAVPVWELGCYTWWAEPNKVYECQQNPEECCGTTLEEHCQKCTCSDGTVIVDSKLTGATCEDLCYYYDHQIKMPDLFQ